MVVMANDGPSPNSPSLRLGLPAPQPSRRHHVQSLLGPSYHDPRTVTYHVLESNPERAAPLSRRDNERCHAIGSHSSLPLYLYIAVYNTSWSCRFWVLDHLCSNLSQSFHPIPLPCALAYPAPSHRDATTPSPCWAPHFMTQERIMFSNPTPSELRVSPTATMSNATPWSLAPSLHCASIFSPGLQSFLKLSLLSLRPSLIQFVSIISPWLNHGNLIFKPVCVFYLFVFCLYFSDRNELQV